MFEALQKYKRSDGWTRQREKAGGETKSTTNCADLAFGINHLVDYYDSFCILIGWATVVKARLYIQHFPSNIASARNKILFLQVETIC